MSAATSPLVAFILRAFVNRHDETERLEMSDIKILSRNVSELERSIIFEVDGDKKLASAPIAFKTFEQLEADIRAQFGGGSGAPQKAAATRKPTAPKPTVSKPTRNEPADLKTGSTNVDNKE